MPRIIDLDLIAPPSVTIRKNGVGYDLPGDPPVSMWLGIIDAHDQWIAAQGADSNDAMRLFHDRMLRLFQIEQPDLQELPFGPAGMFAILTGFYGAADEPDEDPPGADEAALTKRTTNGSDGSRAKPKTTTRSRSSR